MSEIKYFVFVVVMTHGYNSVSVVKECMNIDVNYVIMFLSLAVPNRDLPLVFGITPDPDPAYVWMSDDPVCVWDAS